LSNGAIFDDLGARLKVKPGDNMLEPAVKNYPLWNLCLPKRPPTKVSHVFYSM